ncbi:TetR/AcrR family transcriptional regulator [Streptomyces carminius]|uniref:TetR/AcrR family transcriptional regulator n=1 Tax=Streptomyces carminius TaxID=2665496 RepID=UPI001E4663C2|nr:TetR family transcriptional regulator [Streptomyces carminius]
MSGVSGVTGLRERKKRRTRDALIRTAHELFVAQGYERTTVDEIADAVEVSQRTFFRYFANKEEAAFALQRMVEERFFAAVGERPLHETPIQVLGNALGNAWYGIREAIQEVVPIELYMRMWQLIETTPALVAVHLRHSAEQGDRLAAELARRAGVDPEDDPRPHVLVAAFAGVMQLAGRRWAAGDDVTVDGARRLFQGYLSMLGPALAEGWGPAPGAPPPP